MEFHQKLKHRPYATGGIQWTIAGPDRLRGALVAILFLLSLGQAGAAKAGECCQNQPPVLNSIGDKTVTEGETLTFVVTGYDPNNRPFTYSASGLPPGASFDPGDHTFQWTPTVGQAGIYTGVYFQIINNFTKVASETITITVLADADGDGVIDDSDPCPQDAYNDGDGDGFCSSEGDCDDIDYDINPGVVDDCDGTDDNCDGIADDGYVSLTTACGVGACATTGVTSCMDGVVHDSCAPGSAAQSDITCDGIDDNCDGTADDGHVPFATVCGVGPCTGDGFISCVDGNIQDSCADENLGYVCESFGLFSVSPEATEPGALRTLTLLGVGFGPGLTVQMDDAQVHEVEVIDVNTADVDITTPASGGGYDITVTLGEIAQTRPAVFSVKEEFCPDGTCGLCNGDGDCLEGDVCTQDVCVGGSCTHVQVEECCPAMAMCAVCESGGDMSGNGVTDVVDIQCMLLGALWELIGLGPMPVCLGGLAFYADLDCGGDMSVVDVLYGISMALENPLSPIVDTNANNCVDTCEIETCGTGQCAGDETCVTCPGDCGPCPGDCCVAGSTPGCSNLAVQECVCELLPKCCYSNAAWDGACAQAAETSCNLSCPAP